MTHPCKMAIAAALFALTCLAVTGSSYHVSQSIRIGGEGSWDYLAVDDVNRHLFVSHFSQVEVIDLNTGKPAGVIPGTPGVHGIAVAPKQGRGFITCGNANNVVVFDLKSLEIVSRVPTGGKPDSILFDPASNRVFAMNGKDGSSTVIDAVSASVLGTIQLGGKPEFTVADGKGKAFVNLEDKDAVARFDTAKMQVTATWPVSPCKAPGSMAIDRKSNRLFIGCHNDLMVVVDTESGKVVAEAPVGHGVDAAAFDSQNALIFQSSGDGKVTVVHQDAADKYSVVGSVTTAPGAKTMTIDPKTHYLYLSVADLGPAPAATAETPNPKPSIVPGTFRVIMLVP
jgi:DNA-binding beta-propeller fold protein YncE